MILNRIPIRGWRKCVYEAAAFDTKGEFAAASLLDDSTVIIWWFRNDPPRLRIPTPIGYFEPDFVYLVCRMGKESVGVLEVKGDIFWDGPDSEARIKANAAVEWVRVTNEAMAETAWEFAVVLDQDAIQAASFEAMLSSALLRFPEQGP
jgi:restriction endonuclease